MSIISNFPRLNEECVVCHSNEGDDRLYMPLCGITRCLPNYRIKRNVSRECVIEYIISGSGCLRTSYAQYTPSQGDVYILHRGSTHEYWTNKENCWTKIWFNIQGNLVDELLRIYGLSKVEYFPMAEIRSVFEECLELMKQNLNDAHKTATLVTHRLIYEISKKFYSKDGPASNPSAVAIKKWVEAHLHTPIQLESLASEFSISIPQLIRIFEKEFNITPYKYYLERRLDYAEIMLKNTRKTVKEIAYELCFADQYYFSNVFKKRTGISPAEYRKQHIKHYKSETGNRP